MHSGSEAGSTRPKQASRRPRPRFAHSARRSGQRSCCSSTPSCLPARVERARRSRSSPRPVRRSSVFTRRRGSSAPAQRRAPPGWSPAAADPRAAAMRAMLFTGVGAPLRQAEVAAPAPGAGQVLLDVHACGVCRTDLHIVDGELGEPKLPLVLGHQIVGTVSGLGDGVTRFEVGQRVGVPWLGWTCGRCRYCLSGRENLCDNARFTGYTIDGGYAEQTVADERFCFPIPTGYPDLQAAPLLCAGLIGYRALRLARAMRSARPLRLRRGRPHHLPGRARTGAARLRLHALRRRGQPAFARSLGAEWAGASRRAAAGAARCRDHLRPRRGARPGRARRGREGRKRRLRRAST